PPCTARARSATSKSPGASVSNSWGGGARRPSPLAKLGIVAPAVLAAAPARGESAATAVQASERTQSPTVRLSIGTFSTVQPISVPPTKAFAATKAHKLAAGGAADRREANQAATNTTAASTTPPAACQRQCGWLETVPPQANLALRA